ncbi:MAG: hypothetical protein U9R08_04630 [Nanoarchaeota archaeon]|nr:hypothetical protein [Nanoarchaeota archaeon]
MNKAIVTIISILIISLFSFAVYAETESPVGTFTIGNAAPDSPYDWTPTTTHDKDQTFSWTEGSDPNGDPVSTYVCISADTDDNSCDVVNAGPYADPSYAFTQVESNWDYTWGTASRNYYIKLTPTDGTSNGTINDTLSFTLTDAIPTVSTQTSDSSSGSPKHDGEDVTFSMTSHTDTDAADNHSLRVCKTNAIGTDGTCTGGEWCNEYAGTYSDDADLGCAYTLTSGESSSTYDAYFFVCDCPPNDDSCPGQCSTGYSHTFHVNHKPTASSVDITPNNPTTSQTLTCSYSFADGDSDSEGTSTFRWYNFTGSAWALTGFTSSTIASSNTGTSDIWMCEVTPVDEHSYIGDAVNSTNETIQNTPPNQPSGFEIQDGAANWDSSSLDTHDQTPNMQWTTSDNDGDTVTTYVCISTTSGNRDTNTCDAYSSSTSSDAVSAVSGLDYSGTNRTYYVRLTPNDGSENGTAYDVEFNLLNSLPAQPTSFLPLDTHDQTPTLTWTATDPDDGTDNHWPADTLTYHLRVGTSYGDGTYENNDAANKAGEDVDSAIPWGVPGTIYANNTVYVQVWTTDGNTDGTGLDLNTTLDLLDYLPDITDVSLTDAGSAYSSCTSSTCALNPVEHSNATVAVKLTATDTDDDCDTDSTAYIYLCLNNASCSESSYDFGWQVDSVSRSGSTCTYEFTTNKTQGTPQFFDVPNANYQLFVNISSQAGKRVSDGEDTDSWIYGTLKAIDYPSLVTLGDGSIDLNQWNPGTSLATMTNWGNDNLNLEWSATNPTSGTDTWNLTGTDFQIDDDNSQSAESSGYVAPVYMNTTAKTFEPGTGLEVCSAATCSDNALNETLDTYYHIYPPTGLSAGTYNTTITITLS